jgi:hypothetical protein
MHIFGSSTVMPAPLVSNSQSGRLRSRSRNEQCMTRRSDPNRAYWEQYEPFQHVKHELIRCYLNGWYPKLGTWAGRVLYVDTHAGRGRYESGDPGSPVVALQTLLRHSYREKLLNASDFQFPVHRARSRESCGA